MDSLEKEGKSHSEEAMRVLILFFSILYHRRYFMGFVAKISFASLCFVVFMSLILH